MSKAAVIRVRSMSPLLLWYGTRTQYSGLHLLSADRNAERMGLKGEEELQGHRFPGPIVSSPERRLCLDV